MARSKLNFFRLVPYSLISFSMLLLLNSCGGGSGGGSGGGGTGGKIIQVPIVISSGGITVGLNNFNFELKKSSQLGETIQDIFAQLFSSNAYAAALSYRVSPDKAKLRLTNFSFIQEETNTDTSVESAFNLSQSCEIDYDKSIPNQDFTCTVELQVGLHYKTIDFSVAPNVDVYINDSSNGIYTTASGLTTADPGAGLDYFTATYNNNNTNFHAEFPYTIDTTLLSTTLSSITTLDNCDNTIETKLVLSDGTVLSDVTTTPAMACGTTGTNTNTVNIGTQNMNVIVDMIHGIQVDDNSGSLSVNTSTPWWTIVGTFGSDLAIKHYASTASGLSSATYPFPPATQGINEVKIAYANGVAVSVQMIPNGFSGSFCQNDYDTPNNSPGNGYVGSDSSGAAWAVGPWSNGEMTSYSSEYFLDTTNDVFYCLPINADPNPAPTQLLNTFTTNMLVPDGAWSSQAMTRIDQ